MGRVKGSKPSWSRQRDHSKQSRVSTAEAQVCDEEASLFAACAAVQEHCDRKQSMAGR